MNQIARPRVPAAASGNVVVFEGFGPDDAMWQGEGERSTSVEIAFGLRFAAPPHVQVAVSMLDADQSRNLRYRLEADEIGAAGFRLSVHVWDDTRIGRLAVSWLAIGERPAPGPRARAPEAGRARR